MLTQALPIGANKALLHFMWMLVSGALFPVLHAIGLAPDAVRRAWRAFSKGVWHIDVGHIEDQRLALPDNLRWVQQRAPDEATLQMDFSRQVAWQPRNFTAHRNEQAEYKGRGRYPIYGEKVRPLLRIYAGREIAATEPDEETY